jgi:hypothetical protein
MATDLPAGSNRPPAPPTTAHKLIGTLNVLFASALMLCGACSGVGLIMQVAMAPMSEEVQKNMQEAMQAQQKQELQKKIDDLKAREDAAPTDEEKSKLAAERQALELQPPLELPMADMMGVYRDPIFIGYLAADFTTAVVLNLLLLASGIGLLAAKAWGRKLGVWVAALKILRLVAVYGFALIFVVPVFSQKMGAMMDKFMAQAQQRQQQNQPGAPPMPPMGKTVGTVYGMLLSAGAVVMMLFGAIYPIVMLWVLTRPKVKAACGEPVLLHAAESP